MAAPSGGKFNQADCMEVMGVFQNILGAYQGGEQNPQVLQDTMARAQLLSGKLQAVQVSQPVCQLLKDFFNSL
jgi:hypothetical protein